MISLRFPQHVTEPPSQLRPYGFQGPGRGRRYPGEPCRIEHRQQLLLATLQLFLLEGLRGEVRGAVKVEALLEEAVVLVEGGHGDANGGRRPRRLVHSGLESGHLHLRGKRLNDRERLYCRCSRFYPSTRFKRLQYFKTVSDRI